MAQLSRGRKNRPRRIDEREDWYERDPMDERSGYRDEDSKRYDSSYDYTGRAYPQPRYQGSSEFREELDRDYSRRHDQNSGFIGSSTSSSYFTNQQDNSSSEQGQYYGKGPKGFVRSDDRIKEEVCEALTRHGSIDARDIDVEVENGIVTLTGSVPDRKMKHLAEDCTERCLGVKDITNNIRVKKPGEENQTPVIPVNDGEKSFSRKRKPSSNPRH